MNKYEKAAAFFIVVTLPVTLPLVLALLVFESIEAAVLAVVLVSGWAATFVLGGRFDVDDERHGQSTDNALLGVYREQYVEGTLSERDLERKIERVLDPERAEGQSSDPAIDRTLDLTDE